MENKEENNLICSGRVLTLQQYFEENKQSLHVINGNKGRLGVMLNGVLIEIGSVVWNQICDTVIFHNTLFGEISILYHFNKNNEK